MDPDKLKRRIHAARVLRGVNQQELNALFAADGLDQEDAGKVERGSLPMQKVHLDAFVRHLGVPERWFTADNVDDIVGWHADIVAAVNTIGALRLAEALTSAAQELQVAQATRQTERSSQDHQSANPEGAP